MDLSNYEVDNVVVGDSEQLAPGRYNVSYVSAEEIQGKNGWVAAKILFSVEGEQGKFVNCTFTLAHNKDSAVNIGKTSLMMLAKAAGLTNLTNTDDLKGKTVSVEVKHNEKGYAEIADDYGKSWQAVETKKVAPQKTEVGKTSDIPF
jgi:predicted 3-demethylubiquinone-9 3-methyltransferase (glyoxalase superfamily)